MHLNNLNSDSFQLQTLVSQQQQEEPTFNITILSHKDLYPTYGWLLTAIQQVLEGGKPHFHLTMFKFDSSTGDRRLFPQLCSELFANHVLKFIKLNGFYRL